ncbi:hypothetical protein M422DRAFT_25900 [Sphaerobolus stellatus SS14]|nr:hypothetical protein M422DRAFT_25900 [Sphaerobolus stellatus SS14]
MFHLRFNSNVLELDLHGVATPPPALVYDPYTPPASPMPTPGNIVLSPLELHWMQVRAIGSGVPLHNISDHDQALDNFDALRQYDPLLDHNPDLPTLEELNSFEGIYPREIIATNVNFTTASPRITPLPFVGELIRTDRPANTVPIVSRRTSPADQIVAARYTAIQSDTMSAEPLVEGLNADSPTRVISHSALSRIYTPSPYTYGALLRPTMVHIPTPYRPIPQRLNMEQLLQLHEKQTGSIRKPRTTGALNQGHKKRGKKWIGATGGKPKALKALERKLKKLTRR